MSAPAGGFRDWKALIRKRAHAAADRSRARGCLAGAANDDATHLDLLCTLAAAVLEAQKYTCAVCGRALSLQTHDDAVASLDRLDDVVVALSPTAPATYLGAAVRPPHALSDVNFRWLCVACNVSGRACFMDHARWGSRIACTNTHARTPVATAPAAAAHADPAAASVAEGVGADNAASEHRTIDGAPVISGGGVRRGDHARAASHVIAAVVARWCALPAHK